LKGYLLPAKFGLNLAWIKALALIGAFLFIWLTQFGDSYGSYGPPWLYWLVLVVLLSANFAYLRSFSPDREKQAGQYLISLLLDLFGVVYLCLTHPDLYLTMLIGLAMICSFYSFVLPRDISHMVVGGSLMVCAVALFYATSGVSLDRISSTQAVAELIIGTSVLLTVFFLSRAIRHSMDNMYVVTEELAYDLTSQAIEAYIAQNELTERHQEANTMLQILQNVVSILDWDALFKSVVQAFRHRFKFDKFSIYLYNQDKGVLELAVESGTERAASLLKVMNPGDGVVGWCFTHGRGILVQDARNDPRFMEISERGKRIRSLACVPLNFRAQTLGVLCLDSEKPGSFDEKAFSFLERLTPLISIAVSNSMSYTVVKEESFTDSLTGLRNLRGFKEIFVPLLSEAYCDDFSLALMVMDIDNFKKINDTYGHQVGNIILTELSQILKDFFRGSDVVARFGGEEFVVVLNGTPFDIAPRIAEQLRRKIEAHQFPISLQRDAFKQVTVSLGLSTTADTNLVPEIASGSRGRGEPDRYVKNATEIAELIIDNADQALYVAKREGKNQVRLSFHWHVQDNPRVSAIPLAPDDRRSGGGGGSRLAAAEAVAGGTNGSKVAYEQAPNSDDLLLPPADVAALEPQPSPDPGIQAV